MKFRMVDRILAWEPRRMIRGVKAVSFEEYELRERLGDEPCLPESLVMEALFQLGNWLIVLSSDYTRMGLVVQWGEVRFLARLRPGRRLLMEVNVRTWRDDGILLDGSASDGEKTIVTGSRCLAVPVALADYRDPDDLRVLFSEIHPGEDPKSCETAPCPA
jgi:3-hydroxymyristoyl/3-hydroxydecanoyl-(acyl carrier protein) dehydratase